MNRRNVVYGIIGMMLVASLFANIVMQKKILLYEDYLSEQKIANVLRPMGTNVKEAEEVLENVVKTGQLTKGELDAIIRSLGAFAGGEQELRYLRNKLDKSQVWTGEIEPYHFIMLRELRNFEGKFKGNDRITLTENEKKELKKYHSMVKAYFEIFGETAFYSWDFSIRSNQWLEVIRQISEINSREMQY